MGEVYRAHDPRLQRDAAIKVLPVGRSGDGMARLKQEARLAGSINHPNIVTVFDLGVHAGRPFVVLELLQGGTLRAHLRGMAPRRAVEIAVPIARGLAAAHEKGIVHRDLKPENVFVADRGPVKILDLGLARMEPSGRGEAETSAGVDAVVVPVLAASACTAYNYCVQYTIRGIPATVDEALRERARAEGKSLNEAAIDALAEGSGAARAPRKRRHLDDIAGTWKAEKAVEAALAAQDRVDKALWR